MSNNVDNSAKAAIRHARNLKHGGRWPSSLMSRLLSPDERAASRGILEEAREHLHHAEITALKETDSLCRHLEAETGRLEQKANALNIEARQIDAEMKAELAVITRQARLEQRLADKIRDIADQQALLVLDKMREASDSIMSWTGKVGDDLGSLMKQEAAEQVVRKVNDIDAVRQAMKDEERAVELLNLAQKLREEAA
jgi:hypothetical protein